MARMDEVALTTPFRASRGPLSCPKVKLLEATRPVVDARPVLSIVKSVEVEKAAVEEPIAKSIGVLYDDEAAKRESFAKGEVVPSPRRLFWLSKKRPDVVPDCVSLEPSENTTPPL